MERKKALDLNFLNNLFGNKKNTSNENQSFINKLKDCIENKVENDNELGIIEKIEENRKISIVSRNTIQDNMSMILKEYSKGYNGDGCIYFAVEKEEGNYILSYFEEENENFASIPKDELPYGTTLNSVVIKNDEGWRFSKEDSEAIARRIEDMAKDILDKQDEELNEFRKENHLYMVEEYRKKRVYLTDITDKNNLVLEEVEFPEELKQEAAEGNVFMYKDGKYSLYSKDGFERIEN